MRSRWIGLTILLLAATFVTDARASEPGTVRILSANATLEHASGGDSHLLLAPGSPAKFLFVGPMKVHVEARVNRPATAETGPDALLDLYSGGKPLKRFRLAAKGNGGAWKGNARLQASAMAGFVLDVGDGIHAFEFRTDGKDGIGLLVVPAGQAKRRLASNAPVIAVASSQQPPPPKATAAAPAPTPAPAVVAAAPADPRPESAAAGAPAGSQATPRPDAPPARGPREPRFDVGPEVGYVLNGGDVNAMVAGIGAGWRPASSGFLRDFTVRLAAEFYAAKGSRTATDPVLGEFTRSYEFSVLPVVLGLGWTRGMGPVDLLAEADVGAYLVQGSWNAENEQGAIEPATKVGGVSPGVRLGIGAARRLGPGALTGMLRFRMADIDNGESFDPVYPQDSGAYEVLGDVGGMSATLGYRFAF